MTQPLYVPRLRLAFRVGVTGSRRLSSEALAGLSSSTTRVLGIVREEIARLGRDDPVSASYDTAGEPMLRLLSPLAEGADRLVAEAALPLGYTLDVALPFVREEYETDFPQSTAAFDVLLAAATHRLELDGSHAPDHLNRSYEAVGRHVVRNVDLLIALWDGHPAKGRGGTGDIVRFAIRVGVPVWWIPDNGVDVPRTLRTMSDLRRPLDAPAGEKAEQALRELLGRAVRPPQASPPPAHTVLNKAAQASYRLLRRRATPLQDYLREDDPKPRKIWHAYAWFMNRLAPRPHQRPVEMLPPDDAVEAYWHKLYTVADALSQVYGDKYRSSYLLIFLFAFGAAACAVLSLLFPTTGIIVTVAELTALMMIAVLVTGNHFGRWHERWVSYRLLAELCRKQQALAPLGWSLPNWEVDRLAAEGIVDPDEPSLPRGAWAAWYFTAGRRAAPLPEGRFTELTLQHPRDLGSSFLAEQETYHRMRGQRSSLAGRRLGNTGEWLFVVTLIGIGLKLVLLWNQNARWTLELLGLICALLPAAAAALIGVRTYSEFELLAHQSTRMELTMRTAMADLSKVTIDRPLASQDLGEVLYMLSLLMLQDIIGWAQLFRLKILEAS